MAKKKDLGGLQLSRHREDTAGTSESSVVSAVRSGTESRVRRLPLGDIADNPENPATRVEDVAELAESLVQVGQLQPGLVVSAREYLAGYPQHADVIGSRSWVLLAGHRRKAAAQAAGLEVLEVLERSSERMDEAVLHENLHRRALSPLEEASSFQRVMDRNDLSQREMAQHAGVSQSYLAKRLALLKLPPSVQQAIEDGVIAPSVGVETARGNDAEVLSELEVVLTETTPDLSQSWILPSATREAAARVRARHALREAHARASLEGVPVVENPEEMFGPRRLSEHRLTDDEAIEAARADGDLAYVPAPHGQEEPVAVRLSKPVANEAQSRHEDERTQRDKQRKAANDARRTFLAELVKKKPAAKDRMSILTLATLHGAHLNSQITTATRRLAQGSGIGPAADQDAQWRAALLHEPLETREHLAWISALVALEDELRWQYATALSPAALELISYLTERGYTLSDYESDLVAASTSTKEDQE